MVNRSYSQGNPCQAIFRSLSVSEIPGGPIANHVMRILDTWIAQVALYAFIHSFIHSPLKTSTYRACQQYLRDVP